MVRKLKNNSGSAMTLEAAANGLLNGSINEVSDKLKSLLPSAKEVAPIEHFEDRVKHFLFYSGGTDSTLILEDILKVMEHNEKDKLVIITVKDKYLGSGQKHRLMDTMTALSTRMGKLKSYNRDVYDRVNFNMYSKHLMDVNAPDVPGSVEARENMFFGNKTKKMQLQELLLINHAYNIVLLCENCHNRVYLGQSGGDLGNSNFDRLKRMFKNQVEFMVMDMLEESSLNDRFFSTTERKINNMSLFDSELVKKVVPVLEFPLKNTKKENIMYRLKNEYPFANYDMSTKIEDLLLVHGQEIHEEVQIYGGLLEKLEHTEPNYRGVMGFKEFINKGCREFHYIDSSDKKVNAGKDFIKDARLHTVATLMKRSAVATGIL